MLYNLLIINKSRKIAVSVQKLDTTFYVFCNTLNINAL
jgi:hypothetical protein